jgi:hypothetical protein
MAMDVVGICSRCRAVWVVNALGAAIWAFDGPDLRNTLRYQENFDVGLRRRRLDIGTSSAVGNALFQI